MDRALGKTGFRFFPIGLGAMPLSLATRPPEFQAAAVIEAFVEGGGNFIDTANVYCRDDDDIGHNETLIAKTLAKLDAVDRIFVATKGGLRRPKGDWTVDGSPKWLRASCEASLRALNTDRIGLYQLHAVDRTVGLHASLGELAKLQAEGKILHIGLSNVGPDDLREALNIVPIVSVQNRCNVLEIRDFKTGLVDLCREHGMTFIPHSPVGGHSGHSRLREQAAVTAIAERHGCSVYGIALAWLLQQGEHILPIPGASKIASIEDSLRACSITLSSDELETLDRLGR